MSRTQCHKGLDLWSCNQLLVIQFWTSHWYLKIGSQFCTWFGNRVIVLWVKVRMNCIIRLRIPAIISVHEIWIMSSKVITTVCMKWASSLPCWVFIWCMTFLEYFFRLKYSPYFFPVLDSFSQFWTGKTGKNRFIIVYPILEGKNRFWTGKTQPWCHVVQVQ